MPTACGLVVEVRGASVSLATAHEHSDVLCDAQNAAVHSLASPTFWSGLSPEIPLADAVSLTQEFFTSEQVEEDRERLGSSLTCLIRGLKDFAEAQQEHDIVRVAVVVPAWFSDESRAFISSRREHVGVEDLRSLRSTSMALFANELHRKYDGEGPIGRTVVVEIRRREVFVEAIVIEEEILEPLTSSYVPVKETATADEICSTVAAAVDRVLAVTSFSPEDVDEVVVTDERNESQREQTVRLIRAQFPKVAVFDNSYKVHLRGGMLVMSNFFVPSDPSSMCIFSLACLTLGLETYGGVMTPIVLRNMTLPTRQTLQVRVNVIGGTDFIRLRFFEGERVFARDNTAIATLQVENLEVGQHKIQICVEMESDYHFTIKANVVGESGEFNLTSQVSVRSSVTDMSANELNEYFEDLQRIQSANIEDATRQAVEAYICTVSLLDCAIQLTHRSMPAVDSPSQEIFPVRHRVIRESHDEAFCSKLVEVIDEVDWSDRKLIGRLTHDTLLDRMCGRIASESTKTSPCLYCASRKASATQHV